MFLKGFLILITVASSLFVFSPQIVFASCAPPSTLTEYKEQADIVVLGKVTKVSNDSSTVSVERYFKGHGGPSQIQVTGKEDAQAITSVDFSFEEGKRYLLFLQKPSGNSVLKTNSCVGNREVANDLSTEDLSVLGSGYSPNGTTQDLSDSETNEVTEKTANTNLLLPAIGGIAFLGLAIFALNKRKRKSSR